MINEISVRCKSERDNVRPEEIVELVLVLFEKMEEVKKKGYHEAVEQQLDTFYQDIARSLGGFCYVNDDGEFVFSF